MTRDPGRDKPGKAHQRDHLRVNYTNVSSRLLNTKKWDRLMNEEKYYLSVSNGSAFWNSCNETWFVKLIPGRRIRCPRPDERFPGRKNIFLRIHIQWQTRRQFYKRNLVSRTKLILKFSMAYYLILVNYCILMKMI